MQASGRSWKEAGQRAGTLRSQNVSSSWDEKMRVKAETKIFRENRAAAIATRKVKLQVCPMALDHCSVGCCTCQCIVTSPEHPSMYTQMPSVQMYRVPVAQHFTAVRTVARSHGLISET